MCPQACCCLLTSWSGGGLNSQVVCSKFGKDKRRLICPVSPGLLADGPAGSVGGAGGRWARGQGGGKRVSEDPALALHPQPSNLELVSTWPSILHSWVLLGISLGGLLGVGDLALLYPKSTVLVALGQAEGRRGIDRRTRNTNIFYRPGSTLN